ncbi:hypothetical protein D3C81_190580 [compost metagenome]
MEINATPNELLMALIGSLDESLNRPALIEMIKQATPTTAAKVLDDVLVDLAGQDNEILIQTRQFVTELNAWKLLQVMVPGIAGFDIPSVLPLEAQNMDESNIQILSRMPKFTPNEEAVAKMKGMLREKTGVMTPSRTLEDMLTAPIAGSYHPSAVNPTELYEAGLRAAAQQVQEGDRSATRSLIHNTHQNAYKEHQEAEREARLFKSFKDLFFAAAAKRVPLDIQVEATPLGVKFVVAEVTGANIKKALDTGVHGLIGGKRLQEVIKEDEWASRFFLLRSEVDGKLANGEQPQHPVGLLDYTAIFTLIDTPEGYEDKFLYVIASQGVHRTEKKES